MRISFLDWGKPYYFHPDENNIAIAISQLSLTSWNPHFFAYGSLPIYVTFLVTLCINVGKNSFSTSIFTLRLISSILSILLIPSLFYIGKKIYNKYVGSIAAILAATSIGFIQYAHFGTFEMWLTFFGLWFFYSCFLLFSTPSTKHVIFTGLLAGILVSIKISSIVFIPIPLVIIFIQKKYFKEKLLFSLLLYSTEVVLLYITTNPFLIFDTSSFINGLQYEASVATGAIHVFYTQTFLHSVPILFQLQFIYPFLLNPIIFIFFIVSVFIFLVRSIKEKKSTSWLLFIFFFITFLSQAFLFVKWTRYMVPTLPFIYLIIAVTLQRVKKYPRVLLISLGCFASVLFSFAFFITVYPKDSRINANTFAKNYFPLKIALIEPYDIGALAFNETFPTSKIINLYDLEDDQSIQKDLANSLQITQVFLSPSQRLLRTRLTNRKDFPQGNAFYISLTRGTNGFHLAYLTPCDFWCKIIYLGDPIRNVEETATVFDHPIVSIFTK